MLPCDASTNESELAKILDVHYPRIQVKRRNKKTTIPSSDLPITINQLDSVYDVPNT